MMSAANDREDTRDTTTLHPPDRNAIDSFDDRLAALRTLAAGLGHDLGNVLVPLRVHLSSLARAPLSADHREDVEGIRGSMDLLQRLASGLRLLAAEPARSSATDSTKLLAWWQDAGPLLKNLLPRGVALDAGFPTDECEVAVSRAALTHLVLALMQRSAAALRDLGAVRICAKPSSNEILIHVGIVRPSPESPAPSPDAFNSTSPDVASIAALARSAGAVVESRPSPSGEPTFILHLPRPAPVVQRPAPAIQSAFVDLQDHRLRAMIVAELKLLALEVLGPETPRSAAHVLILDDAAQITLAEVRHDARPALLLADPDFSRPGLLAIGAKPQSQAIREALRRLVSP